MNIFTEGKIGNLALKNRWIHSATYEGMADPDGACTEQVIECSRKIAAGGVAANVVSFAFVHTTGRSLRGQIGIHTDDMIPGLTKMASAIKKENCKAFIQIAHAGCHASEVYSHAQSIGPSPMTNIKGGVTREMTHDEIKEAIQWFVDAAKRAKQAGFDGVQIHMAHGYLVCSFLSPHYNHRTDEYGGSVENRARFAVEIVKAVRREVGANYPLIAKLNCEDGLETGTTYEMMSEIAVLLQNAGLDAIELSGGCSADGALWPSSRGLDPRTPEEEGYFKQAAPYYRKTCTLPLILVGGNRTPEAAERMIEDGLTDFLSISRPLIREPGLINRWANGDLSRAKCISCNVCRDRLFAGKEDRLLCPFACKDQIPTAKK